MNERHEQILANIENAGGSATWLQVIEGLSHGEQQRAIQTCRELEGMNLVERVVSYDAETGTTSFVVNKVG
jgi:hypothetical protein